jgi:hypothetical protein
MKKSIFALLVLLLVVFAGCEGSEPVDKPYLSEQVAAMGRVMGEYVSAEYFGLRTEAYRLSGSEQPYTDAWEAIIKEVYEFNYADEHGLLPTVKEVQKQVKAEQKQVEGDANSKVAAENVLEQLGLTWDEYWTDCKPQEVAVQLVKENISAYLQKNNLPDLDYTQIEAIVIDQNILNYLVAAE